MCAVCVCLGENFTGIVAAWKMTVPLNHSTYFPTKSENGKTMCDKASAVFRNVTNSFHVLVWPRQVRMACFIKSLLASVPLEGVDVAKESFNK